jgi:2-dehydro-3-deoxygalactonokinase
MALSSIIGIDWGTSSFRAFRYDTAGGVAEVREAPGGILTVTDGAFADALHRQAGDWLTADSRLIFCGMIGSRQGWREAPYCPAPADATAIAAACLRLEGTGTAAAVIVPGVSTTRPDVMRGEETQILGAGLADGLICTPGTHSKWVRMEGWRIAGFATHMTGELFALLKQHSILGRLMTGDGTEDEAAFLEGVETARHDPALARSLFTVRSYGLFDRVPGSGLADYLSGLLIGSEIAAEADDGSISGPVSLIAAPALAARYGRALARFGLTAVQVDGTQASARGLWRVATALWGETL